jgi:phosphatidylserine/phosphatidylglycerophosphate/cardiolipin synthase-like enzyme
MVSPELVHALTAARRRMTQGNWQHLTVKVAGMNAGPDSTSIREATADLMSQDAAWVLSEALRKSSSAKWSEIGVAMTTVDCLMGEHTPLTEIIWTGPANNRFPVRRIDQVLYDLVSSAKIRIVLVTFAAHRVRYLCNHLIQAIDRGVELTLIVECEDESDGQLTQDAIEAFQNIPAAKTNLYHWPLAKRERNQAGRPGKLHMKCAIVDDIALIGSANLTDDAFNRNMELGLLVREQTTVEALSEHFHELIRAKILVPVTRVETKQDSIPFTRSGDYQRLTK